MTRWIFALLRLCEWLTAEDEYVPLTRDRKRLLIRAQGLREE